MTLWEPYIRLINLDAYAWRENERKKGKQALRVQDRNTDAHSMNYQDLESDLAAGQIWKLCTATPDSKDSDEPA